MEATRRAKERADADAAAAIAAAESRAAVAESRYRQNTEAKLEAERVLYETRSEHEHETRRLRKQLEDSVTDAGPVEVAAARREAKNAESRAERAAKELREAREDVARLKISWAEREAELKGELAGLRSQVGAAAMARWQNAPAPASAPSPSGRRRRLAAHSSEDSTDYEDSENDENDVVANVLGAGKSLGTRATIELMQRHARATARLIENQEKMIAELRAELHSAIAAENPASAAKSPPQSPTLNPPGAVLPVDPPVLPSDSPSTKPGGAREIDWEAAYADIDETRRATAETRRGELSGGPGPVVESVAYAPALRTPSDEKSAPGDGDGDALDGSEGSPSRVGSDDDGSDLISVDERFSPVTPGPGGEDPPVTSPTPSAAASGELVGDLYKKLAALGAQSAGELLMQSPTVERQLSRML